MKISVLREVQVGICLPLYKHVSLLSRFFSLFGMCQSLLNVLRCTTIAFLFGGCPVDRRHLVPLLTFFTDMDASLLKFATTVASKGNERIVSIRRKICQNWEGGGKPPWDSTE